MSEYTIREAVPADAEGLAELYYRHLTQNPPADPPDLALWAEKLAKFAADPAYHLLVCEAGGRVAASVTLVVAENLTHGVRPWSIIENVVTHADFRGRGYASALIAHAVKLAKAAGCYKVMLATGSKKESTLRFYRNCGFESETKTAFLMKLE